MHGLSSHDLDIAARNRAETNIFKPQIKVLKIYSKNEALGCLKADSRSRRRDKGHISEDSANIVRVRQVMLDIIG